MGDNVSTLNVIFTEFYYWVTVVFMFLIHVGFCMYEVGASRRKNHMHTLMKNTMAIPLVTITNSMKVQIPSNIAKLGAPFHAVLTAEEAGAYKPHFKAFEYMFDTLGCGPEDITHVSSSFRHDLMSAYDLGIKSKVWVNRGHEPANPFYEYTEIPDVSHLPTEVGAGVLRVVV